MGTRSLIKVVLLSAMLAVAVITGCQLPANNGDNGNGDGDYAEGAIALKFTHTGTLVATSEIQDQNVDFYGNGTLVVEPNQTTTVSINYTQDVDFTNKPSGDNELFVFDPFSFSLTGTLDWEVTYLVDEKGSCIRISSTIGETNTQEVARTLVSSEGTLTLEPYTWTTFDGDLGGTFAPNETQGEDRCTAPYTWTVDVGADTEWHRSLEIKLEVIGFDQLSVNP